MHHCASYILNIILYSRDNTACFDQIQFICKSNSTQMVFGFKFQHKDTDKYCTWNRSLFPSQQCNPTVVLYV